MGLKWNRAYCQGSAIEPDNLRIELARQEAENVIRCEYSKNKKGPCGPFFFQGAIY